MTYLLRATLVFLALAAPPTEAQTAPYGLEQRIPNNDFLVTSGSGALESMQLVPAFEELWFDRPVFLTHSGDASDRSAGKSRPDVAHYINKTDLLFLRARFAFGGLSFCFFGGRSPRGFPFYLWHEASSTIQLQSAAKETPIGLKSW